MEDLFNNLTHAVEGSAYIALAASFIWGVLSIILSPCHLASIPLIVGFIDDSNDGNMSAKKAFALSSLFSVGILLTIALIGLASAFAGRMLGDVGAWTNYLVAGIFLLVGLHLMGLLPMQFSGANIAGFKRRGYFAAFLLGAIFGVALGPCTFAYMAPMLAVVMKNAYEDFLYSVLLLFSYGVGHCSIIVFAGTFTGVIQKYLNWNETSKAGEILKKICGALVVFGGFWILLGGK